MTVLRLALLEFRRFRRPLRWLIPVGLALVPLLYGSLYLWSNWDPYGRASQIPVAVVDQDQPAVANGQLINAGEQFSQQLRASNAFQWHFTDAGDARDGLIHGRYYFTITVPPDFSKKLASAENPVPERASMAITLNDANNYVVGIVAQAAKAELQSQVNSAAHAAYARAIYGDLSQVNQQLKVASEGAHRLVDGTVLAQQGSAALTQGIDAVSSGSAAIAGGVAQVAKASAATDEAITRLTDAAVATIPSVLGPLAHSDAAGGPLGGADRIGQAAQQGAAALQQFADAHPDLGADPLLVIALQRSQAVRDMAVGAAANFAPPPSAPTPAPALEQAARSAANQLHALAAAARQVSSGAAEISTALGALQSGSRTLQTGADQSNSGAVEIANVIDGALQRIPETSPQQTAAAADVLGSPVGISMDNLNPAGDYGRGLTPFFFAIALWVVGLAAYLFFRPLNLRALAGRVSALTVAAAGWLPVAAVTAVGGLVLWAVTWVCLGLDPKHPLLSAALLVLAAGAFVAIDHFLRMSFGVIGSALILVLLIIQLTACGGLYPIETTPAPFRAVHPFIPMTYLVDGLRVTVSGGLAGNLVRDFAVLAGFLVVFLGGAALMARRQRVWTISRLHPQIEV
ncbi:hypothetical protein A5707_05230 [Mycobacterium kyorinense]|uniref:ABC-2 type transporter transmembrane domain-containing protein n=1 Tax=Mycobacterium kyorinense TaxID=487514 RepID=A0A1A2Z1A5_9MYCO|nr:YhgE/Pip domain-containing protein [Mycobacterium kyorinense]OBI43272.1 hypothetical protein A5707_05230 [Mycobacterium kyorinense]